MNRIKQSRLKKKKKKNDSAPQTAELRHIIIYAPIRINKIKQIRANETIKTGILMLMVCVSCVE